MILNVIYHKVTRLTQFCQTVKRDVIPSRVGVLFPYIVDLFVKTLKERQNCGTDPSLRKLSIKSLLGCHVLKSI